jgi:hypothetical protein
MDCYRAALKAGLAGMQQVLSSLWSNLIYPAFDLDDFILAIKFIGL